MLDWEEIQALNTKTNGQERSLLEHLVSIGAASPPLLERLCDQLHSLDGPYAAHICQIAVSLSVENQRYKIPSWYAGEFVELEFQNIELRMNPDGTQSVFPSPDVPKKELPGYITQATQLVTFIKLEGKRRELYSKYLDCIKYTTFTDQVIGKSGSWLHVKPGAISENAPLTAKVFENDIATRCRKEASYCLSKFLKAYSLAQLQELPIFPYLYGSFTMVAPGRISGGGYPKPLVSALGDLVNIPRAESITTSQIEQYLSAVTATHDRVVTQVIAMSKLIEKGEPELAVVGCISAIEWYINERFPKFTSKNGLSSSLNKILNDAAFSGIAGEFKSELRQLTKLRNDIVHGEPPLKDHSTSKAMKQRANDALRTTIKLLKYVNEIEK